MNSDRLRASEWNVRRIDLRDAIPLIVEHHYAKGCSKTAVYVHGLFRQADDRLCGVAMWLPPTRVACESVNKDDWKRVLALSRMVMVPGTPKNACSFLLARSTDMIRRDGRFVSLVTYADESQGHSGGVYRASGWTYFGRTSAKKRWIDPKTGRQVAQQSTKTRSDQKMRELGYMMQGHFHKHKFVKHLTKRLHRLHCEL